MHLRAVYCRVAVVAAVMVMVVACASSKPTSDFELDVDSDEIRIAISKEAARGMLDGLIGSKLECDGELDGNMKRLLRELDAGGPRARASFREDETTVEGRRHGKRLDLVVRGEGPGRIEATMPWAIGRCLLGDTATIDQATASSIKVKVSTEGRRDFSFTLQ
jgi:hypothetical protein